MKKNQDDVIKDMIKIHGNFYNYSKVEYINTDTKVNIICPTHGEFLITPYHHIHRKQGCPECGKIKIGTSRTERIISEKFKGLIQPEDYKLIPLTKGKFAKVDNEDFDKVKSICWRVTKEGYGRSTVFGELSRYIMEAPENMHVDHINHDTLDNRRSNLRLCTRSDNQCNRKVSRGSSKYKGVWWSTKHEKWVSDITKNGKKRRVGTFTSEEEAAEAYNKAALELHGEFAYLNTINYEEKENI